MSENVTECLAEIERLRAEGDRTAMLMCKMGREIVQISEDNDRLRDRITVDTATIERLREEIRHLRATLDDQMAQQDAVQATMRGTLAPHPADDEPGNYTHNVAPNAPT